VEPPFEPLRIQGNSQTDIEKSVDALLGIEANVKYFLFQKHPDWSDESEYRGLVISEDDCTEFFEIELDKILVGVVLGVDFPNELNPCLRREFPARSGVVLGRIRPTQTFIHRVHPIIEYQLADRVA